MRHRPKHVAEYLFMRAVSALLGRLPYRLALSLGWVLARLMALALRRRMVEVQRRIRGALGEASCSPAQARRIAWLAWRNFVFNSIDTIRLPHLREGWIRRVVDYEGAVQLRDQVQANGRVILAAPHMGSWEMAGMALHFFGLRLSYIVRRQSNPLTDEYLNRLRQIKGFECLERDSRSLLRVALRHLKEGRVLTILPDVRARDDAFQVDFLGGRASVMQGMAVFAKLSGAPIVPACVRRVGWTRHRWQTFEPVVPDPSLDRDSDVRRMTQAVFDHFDRVIREHPEQYFWFNKRWILDPLRPRRDAASGPPP